MTGGETQCVAALPTKHFFDDIFFSSVIFYLEGRSFLPQGFLGKRHDRQRGAGLQQAQIGHVLYVQEVLPIFIQRITI